MGKFSEALKKARGEKAENNQKGAPAKTAGILPEPIESVRLEAATLEQAVEKNHVFNGKVDPRLIVLQNPQALEVECFKVLRAKILTASLGRPLRSILITSPQPLDGKSLVAANLAVTLAGGYDEHVILLDCDLRRPTLADFLGMQTNAGIVEYLRQGDSLAPYLIKTTVKKLTLLPAGTVPPNPSELLSSERMRKLMEELSARYQDRYIIIDAPPAIFAAECEFLSDMVDGILLVIRAGKTHNNLIRKTIENINTDKIIGVVLNCNDEIAPDYRYYQRYY